MLALPVHVRIPRRSSIIRVESSESLELLPPVHPSIPFVQPASTTWVIYTTQRGRLCTTLGLGAGVPIIDATLDRR